MTKLVDLGLTYAEAAHGVQSALAYEILQGPVGRLHPKHMRTGLDLGKAEMAGLVTLMLAKGVFTMEEYLEAMRLGVNNELHLEQQRLGYEFR